MSNGSMIRTGVTADTWRNMIMDAAVAYVNWGEPNQRILGATNGGVTFGWQEFSMRNPEIDGLKGHIAGASRITTASPQIVANMVEISLDVLEQAFPGVDVSAPDSDGMVHLTRSRRVMGLQDHPDNIAMVGTQSGTGKEVVMMVKLPLMMEGVSLPTEEDSEATTELTFVGHYDPSNPELEPWEIIFPIADSVDLSLDTMRAGDVEVTGDAQLIDTQSAFLAAFYVDSQGQATNITDNVDSYVEVTVDGVYTVPVTALSEGDYIEVRAFETAALEQRIGMAYGNVKGS